MSSIQAPTHCPSCNSELVWSNHLLYCRNTSCGSQLDKKIEHFAKTLKIKGLGPAAISKLPLFDLSDIYILTPREIADALSSEKLADKLFAEIQNSRSAPLELVLPAFGVPLIGNTAAKKLSTVIEHISELNEDTCRRAGLGPKATENLLQWYHWDFEQDDFPFDFRMSRKASVVKERGVVCISGKLKSFKTKADATKALNDAGYEVKSSLTKQVTILVNESGVESSKTTQARESGVTIVTNLLEFLEN
jgi:DNA ligase (NAD+)